MSGNKSPEWVTTPPRPPSSFGPRPIWGNKPGWPSRNRSCSWCGRYCGRTDESIVKVTLVHRDTEVEREFTLFPLCIYAPDATSASRALWREWRAQRRRKREATKPVRRAETATMRESQIDAGELLSAAGVVACDRGDEGAVERPIRGGGIPRIGRSDIAPLRIMFGRSKRDMSGRRPPRPYLPAPSGSRPKTVAAT
jgi:hypothetical protein